MVEDDADVDESSGTSTRSSASLADVTAAVAAAAADVIGAPIGADQPFMEVRRSSERGAEQPLGSHRRKAAHANRP